MSEADASIVFLPRPTTLVGPGSFSTQPLDVSRFGSVQFQLWRGPPVGGTPGPGNTTFRAYLEESIDAEHWALGSSTPIGYDPFDDDATGTYPKLFSYAFQLRWFRLRIELASAYNITCWAEGILRDAGGGGAWAKPPGPPQGAVIDINSLKAKPAPTVLNRPEMGPLPTDPFGGWHPLT